MKIVSGGYMNYIEVVSENEAKSAREKALKRQAAGETLEHITGIGDAYYRTKVLDGKIQMSEDVYNKIMFQK